MSRDIVESVHVDEVVLTYRVVGDGPELVVLPHGPDRAAGEGHGDS